MIKVWRAATKIAVLSSALLGPVLPTVGHAAEVPLFAQPRPGDEFHIGVIARVAPPLPVAPDSAASAHPVAGTGNGGCGTAIGEITVVTVSGGAIVTVVANGAAVPSFSIPAPDGRS